MAFGLMRSYILSMKSFLSTLILLVCLTTVDVHAATLRVVTLYAPPMAFEERGEVVGLAADLVRKGLTRMGHNVEISIVPWTRAIFMTRHGDADAIFYAVKNKEREAWFHYPEEHLVKETTVLLKRAGSYMGWNSDEQDYSRIRLGTGRGYYYGPKLNKFLETTPFSAVEEATSIDLNFAKLKEGRIDLFLADLYLVKYFMRTHNHNEAVEIVPNNDGTPLILDSVKSYLAFSKTTMPASIAEEFSQELSQMKKDGTYENIISQYR